MEKRTVNDWSNYGNTLYNLKRHGEALAAYEKALFMDSSKSYLWVNKGDCLFCLEKYQEAIEAFDKALKIDPSNFEAMKNKADSLHNLSKYQEANEVYKLALIIDPKSEQCFNNKGNTLRNLGKLQDAIKDYEEALKLNPNLLSSLTNKGLCLFGLRKHKEALDVFDLVLEKDPNNANILSCKANALHNIGRFGEAIAFFDKSISCDPTRATVYFNKGNSFFNLKKYEDALEAYEKSLKIDPNNISVLKNKGICLHNLNKYDEAMKTNLEILKINPNSPDVLKNIGDSLFISKKYEEAVSYYSHALKIEPNNSEIWKNKGNSLHNFGQFSEALKAFEEALKLDSKNASIWSNRGNTLHNMKKYLEAIDSYEQALKLDLKDTNTWLNKGDSLFALEKFDDAINSYDFSLGIDPNNAKALRNKGNALNVLGKYEEALKMYDSAFAIDQVDNTSPSPPKRESLRNSTGSESIEVSNFITSVSQNRNPSQNNIGFSVDNSKNQDCIQRPGTNASARLNKGKTTEIFGKPGEPFNPSAIDQFISRTKSSVLGQIPSNSSSNKYMKFAEEMSYESCRLMKNTDLEDSSYIISKYGNGNEIRFIGKGSFGKVFLVTSDIGEKIAVKAIESSTSDLFKDSIKELTNMSTMTGHPNIMDYMDYDFNQVNVNGKNINQLFIQMPLASNSLENILNKHQSLPEPEVISVLKQVVCGLMYAHDRQMVHLDLKPDNILIRGGICKIADWGGSIKLKTKYSTKVISEIAITVEYLAPELEKQDKVKINYYHCDIYSLALIVFRMCGITKECLGSIPRNSIEKYFDLYLNEEIFPKIKGRYSKELISLVKSMSAYNPSERKPLEEVLKFK